MEKYSSFEDLWNEFKKSSLREWIFGILVVGTAVGSMISVMLIAQAMILGVSSILCKSL